MVSQPIDFRDDSERAKPYASMESMLQRLMALPSPAEPHACVTSAAHASQESSLQKESHSNREWKPSSSTWGPLAEVWRNSAVLPLSDHGSTSDDIRKSLAELPKPDDLEASEKSSQSSCPITDVLESQINSDKTGCSTKIHFSRPMSASVLGDWFLIIAGFVMWGLAAWIVLDGLGFWINS